MIEWFSVSIFFFVVV